MPDLVSAWRKQSIKYWEGKARPAPSASRFTPKEQLKTMFWSLLPQNHLTRREMEFRREPASRSSWDVSDKNMKPRPVVRIQGHCFEDPIIVCSGVGGLELGFDLSDFWDCFIPSILLVPWTCISSTCQVASLVTSPCLISTAHCVKGQQLILENIQPLGNHDRSQDCAFNFLLFVFSHGKMKLITRITHRGFRKLSETSWDALTDACLGPAFLHNDLGAAASVTSLGKIFFSSLAVLSLIGNLETPLPTIE